MEILVQRRVYKERSIIGVILIRSIGYCRFLETLAESQSSIQHDHTGLSIIVIDKFVFV